MMGHHAAEGWYIHNLVKSLQPDILIVDHEGLESPYEEDLRDVRRAERCLRAGRQHAGRPYRGRRSTSMAATTGSGTATSGLLSVSDIVDTHINTLVPRYTNFILNCPPNNKGLLDDVVVSGSGRWALTGRRTRPPFRGSCPAGCPEQQSVLFRSRIAPRAELPATPSTARTTSDAIPSGSPPGGLPQWIQMDLGRKSAASSATCRRTQRELVRPRSSGSSRATRSTSAPTERTSPRQRRGPGPRTVRFRRRASDPSRRGTSALLRWRQLGIAAATELEVGGPQTSTFTTPKLTDWGK